MAVGFWPPVAPDAAVVRVVAPLEDAVAPAPADPAEPGVPAEPAAPAAGAAELAVVDPVLRERGVLLWWG